MKILAPRTFWLIVNSQSGGIKVLRTILASGEEALPVFSFEDEARMFLELGASGSWRVRETMAGELISILFGPCVSIRKVSLDPLPGPDAAALTSLVSIEREAFLESLLSMQRLSSFESRRSAAYRPADVTARMVALVRS